MQGLMGKGLDGKPKKRGQLWQSAEMNNLQYRMYYEMLEQMACAIYRWEGLPAEIDQRFLELTLFNRGMSVFFYDEEYDAYFATMGSPADKINMYMNPIAYRAYGPNGFHRYLKATECVPIWNNYLRRPDINAMRIYARRLADIDRTIDVNLMSQKMPIFMTVPESQRLTAQNLMKQYTGNEPIVIGADGMFDPSQMGYLQSGAPFITLDLLKAKQTIWAEAMTYFGIDNTNVSKPERVQSAEVEANNGQIEACKLIRLNNRREACKMINRRYDLQVWCDMNKDVSSQNMNVLLSVEQNGTIDKNGNGGDSGWQSSQSNSEI